MFKSNLSNSASCHAHLLCGQYMSASMLLFFVAYILAIHIVTCSMATNAPKRCHCKSRPFPAAEADNQLLRWLQLVLRKERVRVPSVTDQSLSNNFQLGLILSNHFHNDTRTGHDADDQKPRPYLQSRKNVMITGTSVDSVAIIHAAFAFVG